MNITYKLGYNKVYYLKSVTIYITYFFFHRNFTLRQETFLTNPLYGQSCFITVICAKIQQALILNTHIQHCSAIVQSQVITITHQKRTPIMHSRLAITDIKSLVLYS